MDDAGGGAREVISDLNWSLGSRYFVGVVKRESEWNAVGMFFLWRL